MPHIVTLVGGSPWGFRLVGGSDFHASLAISKVTPGGKAEKAGLNPGDVILEINNNDATVLSHLEAQNHVKSSTSTLSLKIENANSQRSVNSSPPKPQQSSYQPSSVPASKPSYTSTVNIPNKQNTWQPTQTKPVTQDRNEDFLPPPPPPASSLRQQTNEVSPPDDLPPPPRSVTVPVTLSNAGGGTQELLCEGCHKQIRGPYLTAQGKNWHPEEFVCSSPNCRRPLKDCGFIEEKGGRYCSGCYERYFAQSCGKCNKKIVGEVMHALNQVWHVTCFVCTACQKPFRDGVFHMENDKPYCVEDFNRLFSTMCKGCGYPIDAGDHYVEAIKAQWHESCFTCTVCHCDLKNAGFYAVNDKPVCSNHKNARLPA
uniref:LIM domain-binding protein 3-like n=1 Tax=Phallusia mammillata TaxID=59560 RepID=A0A6F9DK97_9ASCI|nr:LIM domain-binding protein 3-like [Phallusia mammillata]